MVSEWQANWLERKPYDYVCIAREAYPTVEGHHFHIFVQFKEILDVQSDKYFDLAQYHPNIQLAKSDKPAAFYCKKDGEFWEDGTLVPFFGERKRKRADDVDEIYSAGLRNSTTPQEFMDYIREHAPRDFATSYERLLAMANAVFTPPDRPQYVPIHTRDEFTKVPQEMDDWVMQYLECPQPDRPKTLIVVGPTRLGKTDWARSLGRHVYFNGMFMLDLWDQHAQYAIFDDIDWKYIINAKGFLGGQRELVVTDKYRRKVLLQWNHPIIWLTNKPLVEHEGIDLNWIEGNAKIVQLTERLY